MLLLLQNTFQFNARDMQLIAPELILTIGACVALVMEVILPYKKSKVTAYFALFVILLAAISLGVLWRANPQGLPKRISSIG